jgi:hypothetical protein
MPSAASWPESKPVAAAAAAEFTINPVQDDHDGGIENGTQASGESVINARLSQRCWVVIPLPLHLFHPLNSSRNIP